MSCNMKNTVVKTWFSWKCTNKAIQWLKIWRLCNFCMWSVGFLSSTSERRLSEHMWVFSAALCVVVFLLVATSICYQKKWDRDQKRKQHRCGGTEVLFIYWSNCVNLLYDNHSFVLQMIHVGRALTWLCLISSNGLPVPRLMCNMVWKDNLGWYD